MAYRAGFFHGRAFENFMALDQATTNRFGQGNVTVRTTGVARSAVFLPHGCQFMKVLLATAPFQCIRHAVQGRMQAGGVPLGNVLVARCTTGIRRVHALVGRLGLLCLGVTTMASGATNLTV